MAWSIHEDLLEAVRGGACVAFVGAGFSIPAGVPNWKDLLRRVAARATERNLALPDVSQLLARDSSHALDQVAQLIEDSIERDRFFETVREIVTAANASNVQQRVDHLLGIPFRAILTTNFDRLLPATTQTGVSPYEAVLRPIRRDVFELAFHGRSLGTPVVKLHGDVDWKRAGPRERDNLVLTRRDYRSRLYQESSYPTFLRSVLATTTVLYLGFSFTDAYLNELRSEVLAMLGGETGARPVAYAVANDVPRAVIDHFAKHERIQIYSFDSRNQADFNPFDEFLDQLFRATNPLPRFAGAAGNKRILWVDPHRSNNELGRSFVERCRRYNQDLWLDQVENASQALQAFAGAEGQAHRYDVVVTHFGEGADPATPAALEVLNAARDRAPVVVFAFDRDTPRRRRRVMSAGAYGYFHRFEDLFNELDRILNPRDTAVAL